MATYRGGDSFVLLGDDDMQKLHKLAAQVRTFQFKTDWIFFFSARKWKWHFSSSISFGKLQASFRGPNWQLVCIVACEFLIILFACNCNVHFQPVIGLIVAVLLVLCLVSILLSMICAKCFCCCRKNKKVSWFQIFWKQNYRR